ncbi:hypothetical protein THAOC_11580 [Thalassiosira oceanica]|uniref:Uncharacterized protein n=1 Tax=Thalassiosira oceanica TaxID=159749 RepID=K0SQU8_THAOC|nr:hypothetical protein THAOC_11580 [Thalassiosira oceanica]|eukprot:EJK67394.1 hypothetical protein THAOC_11580 [Thalassiosira oceanica]
MGYCLVFGAPYGAVVDYRCVLACLKAEHKLGRLIVFTGGLPSGHSQIPTRGRGLLAALAGIIIGVRGLDGSSASTQPLRWQRPSSELSAGVAEVFRRGSPKCVRDDTPIASPLGGATSSPPPPSRRRVVGRVERSRRVPGKDGGGAA